MNETRLRSGKAKIYVLKNKSIDRIARCFVTSGYYFAVSNSNLRNIEI